MDRENNDRSMIDRTVGEKKEFIFLPYTFLSWLGRLSCVLRVSRSISHVHPPRAGTRRGAMFGPRLHSRENGLPAAFGPVKTEGFMKNESPCPPSFGPARCGPGNLIFASQVKYPRYIPAKNYA